MKVCDLLNDGFVKAEVSDSVNDYLEELKEGEPVFVSSQDYEGVVTSTSLLFSGYDREEKLRNVLRRTPKLSPEQELSQAAEFMFKNNLRALPVFEDDKMVGSLKAVPIIQEMREKHGSVQAQNIMRAPEHVVREDDPLGDALKIMLEEKVCCVPVINEEDKLVGVITAFKLFKKLSEAKQDNLGPGAFSFEKSSFLGNEAGGLAEPVGYFLKKKSELQEIVEVMERNDWDSLVVKNDDHEVVGVVSWIDLVQLAARKKEREGFTLIIAGHEVDQVTLDEVKKDLKALFKRHERLFGSTVEFYMYLKKGSKQFRGLDEFRAHCKLFTGKDFFAVSGEGWGVKNTFHDALQALEDKVKKKKSARTNVLEKGKGSFD